MRKISIVIIVLVLALIMEGCGGEKPKQEPAKASAPQVQQATPQQTQIPATQSAPTPQMAPQKTSTPTTTPKTQSAITGSDNGYRWRTAIYNEKVNLCKDMADIANDNKMSSKTITWQYLYDSLNTIYDTSEPGILNQQIAEVAVAVSVMR